MKFGNSKVVATIVAMAMATGFTGCSKDENSSVQSDSDTEKDLLTSSSFIDVSTESAQESIDSSLNSHDTSKPIEKTEPDSSLTDRTSESENSDGDNVSSDLTSSDLTDGTSSDAISGDSSLADDKSDSDSDKSDSAGETSKPSDNTTSVPSDSSLADDKSDSDSSNSSANSSSSSSNTAPWSDMPATITIPDGAVGEYFDVNGNPMPDDFDPDEGGFYDKKGRYHTSAEEHAAMEETIRKGDEAIDNGTFNPVSGMTDEEANALWALIGGVIPFIFFAQIVCTHNYLADVNF